MRDRTYRYDDYSKNHILYPFGFGLTYSDIKVTAVNVKKDGDMLKADVTVKNSGKAGADVIEVYFKSSSKDAVRNQALCAFKKVAVEEGEEKTVTVDIPLKNITVVNDDGVRYLDSDAETTLYFGTSQPDELSVSLTGKKPVEVKFPAGSLK